jgi:aminomethyltransferase
MPLQYPDQSLSASHTFTRTHASLFDVSHMAQRLFLGPGAAAFLQRITPSDAEGLGEHRSTLSVLLTTDGKGGIVDDTVVTRLPATPKDGGNRFYVVTNAGCREKDDKYLEEEIAKWNAEKGEELKVWQEQMQDQGLVALQGPDAEAILADVLDPNVGVDLKKVYFGQSVYARIKGLQQGVLISRGGYTGEDGFEISVAGEEAAEVTKKLVGDGERCKLAGLGARDSLRLEAGMCLYGHDLSEEVTPVQAGLSWIIPKARRGTDAGYYGAEVISKQLVPKSKGGSGVDSRRIGLVVQGAPAREGAQILSEDGSEIGKVTSGCPSPTLGKNIAMGFVKDGFHKSGTEVEVLVRGRKRKAVVTKMPFIETKYYKDA